MLRENEKLKNDHRYARKIGNPSFIGNSFMPLQNATNSIKKKNISDLLLNT